VFVSSTGYDLVDLRAKIKNALEAASGVGSGNEFFVMESSAGSVISQR
jgi:hypothetical protein